MNLVLSSREQARVAQALYTLASPFEHASVAAWGEGIIAQVESALQHEGCWVQLPVDGKPAAVGVERLLTPSDLARYKAYEPYLASTGAYERSARLGVVTHETAYGPHYEEVMQSTYIHELREAGVYDMMSILVPAVGRPRHPGDVAQIYLNTFAPQHAFTEQQIQIGHLLHPALKAGMTSLRKLEAVRHRLGALLDASGAACAVFSLGGRLLHRTPALEEALAREPRREDLMERSRSLTGAFSRRRNPLEVLPVPTTFVGARGRYTFVPTCMEGLAPTAGGARHRHRACRAAGAAFRGRGGSSWSSRGGRRRWRCCVGTPTATSGGSGYARPQFLTYSSIQVDLSSMASFRPKGRLYEFGIQPDVPVRLGLSDWRRMSAGQDPVLAAALSQLRTQNAVP